MSFKDNILIIIILFAVLVLSGCHDRQKGIPDNAVSIIPPEIMTDIIYDIYLIDAMILANVADSEFEKDKADSVLYTSLFLKYPYTKQDFEKTLLYYVHYHLDSMEIMLSNVMDRLNIEKGEIMKL